MNISDDVELAGEKLAELEDLKQERVEAFEDMLEHRPAPVADGVDLAPVKALLPDFDGLAFLAVARESYEQMREAWEHHNLALAADLASDELMAQLKHDIDADESVRRYHLLPGFEIQSAVITNAMVADKTITLVVRMNIDSKEYFADAQGNRVSGDDQYHRWDEDWTFTRNVTVDESAEDRAHALIPERAGGWDFAHQGWNVTAITRV